MQTLPELAAAIERGEQDAAIGCVRAALDQGIAPGPILDAMTGAMRVVGEQFQRDEIFVPEMLVAARAMKGAMRVLEPRLVVADVRPVATAILGTVQGDLHDIGKNLVGMMWQGANIEVIDLGTNVAPEAFARAAREHDARIVGISALLTTTMAAMRDAVAAVREGGPAGAKIIVGGAPVTEAFAREIGADAYAPDAGAAADVARTALAS
jgi:5-methyltetrahydrofolate--homocysteine methyltransferase